MANAVSTGTSKTNQVGAPGTISNRRCCAWSDSGVPLKSAIIKGSLVRSTNGAPMPSDKKNDADDVAEPESADEPDASGDDEDDELEVEIDVVAVDDDEDEDDDDDDEQESAEPKVAPVVVAPVVAAPIRPQPGRPPSAREEPPPPFSTGERIILTQNTRPRTGTPIGDYPVGSTGRVETVLSQTAIVRFDLAPGLKEGVAVTCLKTAETPERAAELRRQMMEPRMVLQERTGRPAASVTGSNGSPAPAGAAAEPKPASRTAAATAQPARPARPTVTPPPAAPKVVARPAAAARPASAGAAKPQTATPTSAKPPAKPKAAPAPARTAGKPASASKRQA